MNNQAIQFRYKNDQGEVSLMNVVPYGLIFAYGDNKDKQWKLQGLDVDAKAERFFVLKNCNFVITS